MQFKWANGNHHTSEAFKDAQANLVNAKSTAEEEESY